MKAKKIFVIMALVLALLMTVGSTLAVVNPNALDLVDMKVGRSSGSLVSYDNGKETEAFLPGEKVTFQLKIKNLYTQTDQVDPLHPDLEPTIENIQIQESVDASLTNFPEIMKLSSIPDPFYLEFEEDQIVEFQYTIPEGITDDKYAVNFKVEGDDLKVPHPGNTYLSEKGLLLKVKQNVYDVSITKVELINDEQNDGLLTCSVEKQNKNVKVKIKLVNTGLDDELVRVVLTNSELGLNEFQDVEIIKESSNPGNQYASFDLNEVDITGKHVLTIKAYKQSINKLYDTSSITVTGEDCSLDWKSVSPVGQVLLKKEGLQQFNVEVNNPGQIDLAYKWYVDNGVQSSTSNSYTYQAGNTVGEHTVKVVVNEGTANEISHPWTVTVSDLPAAFEVSSIFFDGVQREATVQTSITIKNVGFESLTGVKAELVGKITSTKEPLNYQAQLLDSVPATLTAGKTATVKLQITVPKGEEAGKHIIGTFKLTGTNTDGEVVTKEANIYIQPKSFLTIADFEVNGKDAGELSLVEVNKILVAVKNDYTADLEDVVVTVKILDVDEEDLDEKSDDPFDLNKGDEEDQEFEFDLTSENVDQDQYTVEITAEGTATDGSKHKVVETKTVKVDRESHQVLIKKAALSNGYVLCYERTVLHLTLGNVGENDEDHVEIRVKNSALGIDLKKSDIEIEKFSSDDNEHSTSFDLEIANAAAGTYPLTVEVYLDGELTATTETNLEVGKNCFADGTTQQPADQDLVAQLQKQLEEYKQSKSGLRNSGDYVVLLGALVALVFIAVALSLTVLVVKKKKTTFQKK